MYDPGVIAHGDPANPAACDGAPGDTWAVSRRGMVMFVAPSWDAAVARMRGVMDDDTRAALAFWGTAGDWRLQCTAREL